MNAIAKVAPELTAEGLVALVRVLPPLKGMQIDRREKIETAIGQCVKDATPRGVDFDDSDPGDVLWSYHTAPFRREPGDPGYVEPPEFNEDDPYASDPNFDDGERRDAWIAHLRDDVTTPDDPWNYLLDEAERLAPGWSRWGLPGAQITTVDRAPAAPLQVYSFDDEDENPPPALAWTVADLIQAQSRCVVVGPSGDGKTTLALLLALHIAAGRPFAGREVMQGMVVYVAAEGHFGALQARVRAIKAEYGIEGALPLRAVDGAGLSLLRAADVDSLLAQLAALAGGQAIRAVILDTLPQLMAGQDENSAHVMGVAVAGMGKIMDTFGAAVIALTHPARGGTLPRGSSALTGAVDTQVAVTAAKRGKLIASAMLDVTKQRNAVAPDPIVFDAKPGLAVFVPIFREAGAPAAPAPAAPKPKLSAKAGLALAWLVKHGPATEAAWRAGIARQITTSANAASQRTAFARVRDELSAAKVVEVGDGGLWRTTV